MTLVSVIMPVYNTKEEYLRAAIESILNQTFSDFEFIIINDGSTNNAEDVILSYKDERIKYLKQENQGIVGALNRGLEESRGEYIARMDSDDISYPERLEKQYNFLTENQDISILGANIRILPQNRVLKMPQNIAVMDLLSDNCLIHPTVMIRKSDLQKYNLRYENDCPYAEDYNLWAKALMRDLHIKNMQEVLLDYRVYPENSTTKNREERIKSSFKVQDMLLNYLTDDVKLHKKLLEIAYSKKRKKSTLLENLFSIKNLYKDWAKYKLLTIFGCEFYFKVKEFACE